FFCRLGSHSLVGPTSAVQKLTQAIVYRAVHLALGLEIRQAQHGSTRGHDACFRISQRLQSLKAADNAADPPTGHPINDGPSLTGDRIPHHEHVLLWEINVQIAVSVRRIRDVPVANTGVELTGSIERLIRLCGFG